jgi:Ran GTPase-activating protein (RanGAP) involved in mRNA processing and transport
MPKAGLLIKDKENPFIDFSNQFMQSASSVAAVAEAVKRYRHVVHGVNFVNNSMLSRHIKTVIDSFSHHFGSLKSINLSGNNMGLDGANHLAAKMPELKSLDALHLSSCNLTDKGVTELLKSLIENETFLGVLDLSGNQIGQSSFFEACANHLTSYIEKNTSLLKLSLNNNMLRGKHAEKVV